MAKKKTINMVKSQVIYKDYSKDAERTALISGENLSHMFGKIARWYTDISWVGHTHTEANITDFGTYAGASTKGGAATSANKLNIGSSDIGSETKPVYFSYLTGKPVACTYSLNASVPANAVFTDINVKQSPSTADESREVLFAGNTGNTETTGTVGKSNKLYFNPSTGALTATSFSGSMAASNLTGTIDAGRLPTTAVTAGSYGPAAGGTLTYGGTFDVPYVTVDKYGRLTAGSTKTFTMPAQYTHPSYTSKTSGLYKITVDGTGHVSGTAAVTASDLPAHTHDYVPNTQAGMITAINLLGSADGTPVDGTYYISQHNGSDGTNTNYYRRTHLALWNYIKGKADSEYAPKSHSHSYLPLSGGTLTGILTLPANLYNDNYALNCNNSNIIGANAIKFADNSDNANEGILFYRSSTTWDSVWASGGVLYFTPNYPTNTTNYTVYHSGNLTYSTIDAASSSHTHGLLDTNLQVSAPNSTTDTWKSINAHGTGFVLRSIRTQANAAPYMIGNYSAGIVFGGADTRGVITHAYDTPSVKFAGGNRTAADDGTARWYFTLNATTGQSYTLPSTGGTLTDIIYKASNYYATSGHTHSYAKSESINGPAYSVAGWEGTDALYRHVWFSTSTDETRRAYNDNFMYSPTQGTLKFTGWIPIDLTGKTDNLNSYNDSTGVYRYYRCICTTTGGGSNITNKPADSPFVLEVILIRWASSSDYITKQIYHGYDKKTYQRFCTNGTWSTWTEQKYTDTVYTHPTYTSKTSGLYKITVDSLGHVSNTAAVTASDLPSHTHNYVPNTEAGVIAGINLLREATAIPVDDCWYISQENDATTTNFYKRKHSALWSYIKGKADSVYAAASHTHSYLPLTGGTLTGALTINTSAYEKFSLYRSGSANSAAIHFYNDSDSTTKNYLGSICMNTKNGGLIRYHTNGSTAYTFLDTGNFSISRSLTSGTKIATITVNGTSTDLYCQTNTDTDVNVTQEATNTTNYRNILAGYTSNTEIGSGRSATVTGRVYDTDLIFMQSSTGNLYARNMIAYNHAGGDAIVEWNRNANASWRIINSGAVLRFQCDWTTEKTTYYDTLILNYNNTSIQSKASIILDNPASGLIHKQNSTSNYTETIRWWKGGSAPSAGTYPPQIGQHNTGDTDGAICILPYQTTSDPWNAGVGLYISKTRLLYKGTAISLSGHTHNYAGSSTAGGDANRAVQANNCKVNVTDPSSSTTYGLVFVADPNTTEDNTLRKSNNFRINHFVGAANTEGIIEIVMGNTTAKTAANNSTGRIAFYNSNGKYTVVTPGTGSSNITVTLPTSGGTLALVGDNNHTHNYAGSSTAGGDATRAVNSNNCATTVTNASSGTHYGIVFVADPGTSGDNTLRKTYDFRLYHWRGAANTEGTTELVLGNSTPKTSDRNSSGIVYLYNGIGYWTAINSALGTANITISLPSTGGNMTNVVYKTGKTLSAVSHSGWTNATTDNAIVPTMSFIAYWNGAYDSSGTSNLTYCNKGAFGTIITKGTGDYVTNTAEGMSVGINKLTTGTSAPVDADYYVAQWANGGTTTTTYVRRTHSALWSYIKGKADSVYAAASHSHSYLPLSGGTLTGNLSLTEARSILLRPNNSNYTAGIGYDTSGNECIALWAKNTVTRLRWYAGTDMTTMTSGTMMGITPDFEISKASGSATGYISGNAIIIATDTSVSQAINKLSTGTSTPSDNDYYVAQFANGGTTTTSYHRRLHSALFSYINSKLYKILWSGSTSCTARSSTSITLTTAISANKYRFIKVVWNCGSYTGTSEFRADTLNVTNNIPSGSDATTTNMIQFKIASDGKSITVGPGTAAITVIQIAGVYPI